MADKEDNSKKEKLFSGKDIQRLLKDLTAGDEGVVANTIFSRIKDTYEYDDIFATAAMAQRGFIDKYLDQMGSDTLLRRKATMGMVTGQGEVLSNILNKIMAFNPDAGTKLMQLPGFNEGLKALLNMGNQIGTARGGTQGGVLDPVHLAENVKFAASQGALAYRNNFNFDGSINTKQTAGINLPTAAMISGFALSDRSQYEEWGRRMKSKDSSLTKEELELDDTEINNFKSGVGTTARAEKSFNAQIKKFTGEINKLVASISKMTGDYGTAIDFLQQLTNGKAFSAGQEAVKLREQASRVAIGMRVAAADAGLPPQAVYGMASHFQNIADYGYGLDERRQLQNTSTTSSYLGSLATNGYAQWVATHQYEGELERERAKMSFEDRVDDYTRGDMVKLNTLASYLIDTGGASRNEVEKYVTAGDADGLAEYLATKVGGYSNVQRFLNSPQEQELLKKGHEATANELHGIAMSSGIDNEKLRLGSRKMTGQMLNRFAARLESEQKASVKDLEKELGVGNNKLILDSLSTLGMKDEDITYLKSLGGLSENRLLEEIAGSGGDVGKVKSYVKQQMLELAIKKYGEDSQQVKLLRESYADRDLRSEVASTYTNSYNSDEVLKASGITDEQIKTIQTLSKKNHYTEDTIRERVREFGGDVSRMDMFAARRTVTELGNRHGTDSKAYKDMESYLYGEIYKAKNTDESTRETYVNTVMKDRQNKLDRVKTAIMESFEGEDTAKQEESISRLSSMANRGLTRSHSGFNVYSREYLYNLFTADMDQSKMKNLGEDEKKKILETSVNEFMGAINAGKSVDQALMTVKNQTTIATNGVAVKDMFKGDFASSDRKVASAAKMQAFNQTRDEHVTNDVTQKFLQELNLNITEEEKTKKLANVQQIVKSQVAAGNSTSAAIAVALSKEFAEDLKSEDGKKAEVLVTELMNSKGKLYKTAQHSSAKFMSENLHVSRAAAELDVIQKQNTVKADKITSDVLTAYKESGVKIEENKQKEFIKKYRAAIVEESKKKDPSTRKDETALAEETAKAVLGKDASRINMKDVVAKSKQEYESDSQYMAKGMTPLLEDVTRQTEAQEIVKAMNIKTGNNENDLEQQTQTLLNEYDKVEHAFKQTGTPLNNKEIWSKVLSGKNFKVGDKMSSSTDTAYSAAKEVVSRYSNISTKESRSQVAKEMLRSYYQSKGVYKEDSEIEAQSKNLLETVEKYRSTDTYKNITERYAEALKSVVTSDKDTAGVKDTLAKRDELKKKADEFDNSKSKEMLREYYKSKNISVNEEVLNKQSQELTTKALQFKRDNTYGTELDQYTEALKSVVSADVNPTVVKNVLSKRNELNKKSDEFDTYKSKEMLREYYKSKNISVNEEVLNKQSQDIIDKVTKFKRNNTYGTELDQYTEALKSVVNSDYTTDIVTSTLKKHKDLTSEESRKTAASEVLTNYYASRGITKDKKELETDASNLIKRVDELKNSTEYKTDVDRYTKALKDTVYHTDIQDTVRSSMSYVTSNDEQKTKAAEALVTSYALKNKVYLREPEKEEARAAVAREMTEIESNNPGISMEDLVTQASQGNALKKHIKSNLIDTQNLSKDEISDIVSKTRNEAVSKKLVDTFISKISTTEEVTAESRTKMYKEVQDKISELKKSDNKLTEEEVYTKALKETSVGKLKGTKKIESGAPVLTDDEIQTVIGASKDISEERVKTEFQQAMHKYQVAHSDSAFGASAGIDSANAFYTSAGESLSSSAMQKALMSTQGASAAYAKKFVELADSASAKRLAGNGTQLSKDEAFAQTTEQALGTKRVLELLNGNDGKKGAINDLKDSLNRNQTFRESLKLKRNESVTEDQVAKHFADWSRQHADLDDEEFEDQAKSHFRGDALTVLQKLQRDSKLSLRGVIESVAAKANAKDPKDQTSVEKAQREAIITDKVKHGQDTVADPKVIKLLEEIKVLLQSTKDNTGRMSN